MTEGTPSEFLLGNWPRSHWQQPKWLSSEEQAGDQDNTAVARDVAGKTCSVRSARFHRLLLVIRAALKMNLLHSSKCGYVTATLAVQVKLTNTHKHTYERHSSSISVNVKFILGQLNRDWVLIHTSKSRAPPWQVAILNTQLITGYERLSLPFSSGIVSQIFPTIRVNVLSPAVSTDRKYPKNRLSVLWQGCDTSSAFSSVRISGTAEWVLCPPLSLEWAAGSYDPPFRTPSLSRSLSLPLTKLLQLSVINRRWCS